MYCDPVELAAEVKASQKAGVMSARLIELATMVFNGMASRFMKGNKDDARQDYLISVLTHLGEIDTEQNCFSWLTTVARRSCHQEVRAKKTSPFAFSCFGSAFGSGGRASVDDGINDIAKPKPLAETFLPVSDEAINEPVYEPPADTEPAKEKYHSPEVYVPLEYKPKGIRKSYYTRLSDAEKAARAEARALAKGERLQLSDARRAEARAISSAEKAARAEARAISSAERAAKPKPPRKIRQSYPTIFLTHNNETRSLVEWSKVLGIAYATLLQRQKRGDSPGDILRQSRASQTGIKRAKRIEHDGQSHTVTEWSEIAGIPENTLRQRRSKGLTGEALFAPQRSGRLPTQFITHEGETRSVPEWSKLTGLSENAIRERLTLGLPTAEVLSTDRRASPTIRKIEHDGKCLTVSEWSELTGISTVTINWRLRKGYPLEAVFGAADPSRKVTTKASRYDKTMKLASYTGVGHLAGYECPSSL